VAFVKLRQRQKKAVIMRIAHILAALFLVFIFSNCGKSAGKQSDKTPIFTSFRDIPGVTADEIMAIEALQREYNSFVYGMNPTTETFVDRFNHDQISGFSTLFCEWLSGLFGIPFTPTLYNWGDLLAGLESGEIDFTGDLMATPERRKTFFMTDPIVERSLRAFRIEGELPLSVIAQSRPLRFAFLENSAAFAPVSEVVEYPFEGVFVSDFPSAYELLKNGSADAFLVMGISSAAFDDYGNVTSELFFPPVFNSASLSTRNPRFSPLIGVVQKALQQDSVRHHLAALYKIGKNDFRRHSLFMRLTEDELKYLQNKTVVKFAAEVDNYPVSFFNNHENTWQGVAHDVLDELEDITGLKFEIANDTNVNWSILLNMLERGDVAMITELVWTDERAGRFLWPHTAIMEDRAMLMSKIEYPDIDISEIQNIRIGVNRSTVYAELFKRWFPNHAGFMEYNNLQDVIDALERGEVDLMMGRTNQFLNIINYQELFGYKINTTFNNYFKTVLGFNKDEDTLCSIIDKTLTFIDTDSISLDWSYKAFDYRYKLIEAQLPWLFGAVVLFLVILGLILVLFYRKRNEGKRLTKLVAEKTSTLMAILDATPDLIFFKDYELRHTECNKSLEKHLNIRKADIIGKNDAEAFDFPLYLMEHFAAKDRKVLAEKQISIVEEIIPSPDGQAKLFETIKSPIIDNGKVIGLVGISRDITQRKAAEEEARKASESKSQFLANMSHEIRTPMNAILGITEIVLQNETLSPTIKEELGKIASSGELLLNIINDILDLSKIEAGKLELSASTYDMARLINDTVSLNMMRIGSKPVEFKLSVAENIPATLFGDKLRIKQVLNNLLSNAFKYTSKGEVKLSFSVEAGDGDDVILVCGVSDTGIGMSKEQLDKLFSEYTRFNRGADRTTEGTGLGLNITSNLLSLMNGGISVESEPDKGSVFAVRLPQRRIGSGILGKETAEKLEKFEMSGSGLLTETKVVYESMSYGSVLIVDDVESNLYVAKGLLAVYDLSIDTAVSGFEAINKIKNGKVYDILFMDHMMPKMDGIEATQKIRGLGYTAPIVALTANAIVGQSDIFLQNGFDAFIPKPIDVRQLNVLLKKFIRDKQPPEVIAAANRQKGAYAHDEGVAVPISSKLAETFIKDASKSIKTLEGIYEKRDAYDDEDIRLYTINVHAMKSALLNVGEKELSELAFKLEQSGRAKDTAVMTSETPGFLDKLRATIERFTSKQEDDGKTADEDTGYLREKLLMIIQACEGYERKIAKDAIVELRQKEWSRATREMLGTMAENLLNGDFEEVANIAKKVINPLE
jgi:PAS domain S-box-containing protein